MPDAAPVTTATRPAIDRFNLVSLAMAAHASLAG
jgi:hypothetical protein